MYQRLSQFVVQHIKECRNLKHLADAKPIITLECNLRVMAQQLMDDIKRLQAETEFMTLSNQTKLEKDRIYFAQSFVNTQFDDTKADILTQLRNFREQRGDNHFVENLLICCYR